jgi:hypothetical protein
MLSPGLNEDVTLNLRRRTPLSTHGATRKRFQEKIVSAEKSESAFENVACASRKISVAAARGIQRIVTLLRVARVCELSARRLYIVPAIHQRQSSFMFDKTTAPHKMICVAEQHERSITAAHIRD